MKFCLPRQTSKLDLTFLIKREIAKQELAISPLSPKHRQQLKELIPLIKKGGFPPYLLLHDLPHNLGKGVFLAPKAAPLPRGMLIGPYAGEMEIVPSDYEGGHYAFTPIEKIRLSREEQAFLDKDMPYKPRRSYTLKVDALHKGNFTRFVNHSSTPNLEARLCRVPQNDLGLEPSPIEVFYFTKKKIHPGEQLLVCYEGEENCYWNEEGVKPYPMKGNTFFLNLAGKICES